MDELGAAMLAETLSTYRKYREMAEKAAAQVDDDAFFRPLSGEENSIALVMKHVGGNLRSRFTDFLTSDGEKPDRDRDGEFETAGETRADVLAAWNAGWDALFAALQSLAPGDLTRTITIRGEPHSVTQALLRSLSHTSSHVGQIVLLAKHWAGDGWRTLSIPRRGSAAFNAAMAGRSA
jgi:hypothetical protein